ncbi:PrsW family intramembrane metalloprotease [Streptococcus gallolyticus]|nr:PrsW family intramembrane metalloprotease [Streptococcus gallolyticus]
MCFIYLFFISLGFEFELAALSNGDLSNKEYILFGNGVAILLLYIIPLLLVLRWCYSEYNLKKHQLALAIFSGFFISGWSAALANQWLGNLWKSFLDKDTFSLWETAMTAPFTEEFLKLLAAVFVLFFLKTWKPRQAFLIGAGVGLGFQISEDISYVLHSVIETPTMAVSDVFLRISGSLTSHWLMTALVTASFCLLLCHQRQKKWGAIGIFATILFHFLWNSPLTSFDIPLSLHIAFLNACYLFLCYYYWKILLVKD